MANLPHPGSIVNATPEHWMDHAIAQARLALTLDEVPIGCVIIHEPTQKILAAAHNRRENDHDPTAHAEILALRQAAKALGDWRLIDCTLIVTLEPCPMCAGAMVNARIPHLIYGCDDPKAGAARTLYNICDDARLNHRMKITAGVRATECAQLLQDFFRARRSNTTP
jgi:tRNA(adenine34) deaminase